MSGCSIAVLESGPFNEYGIHRNNSMLRDYHVLYIDAVPGTGFSKVDDDCKECYRTNSSQVATDLVKVVIEFFERKPYLQSVPSFIYAQSYGAQIAVKFGLLLDEAVEKEICKGDFRGVFLISPWISPFHLIESWPEYFYILGYIDENEKYKLYSIVEKIRKSLNKKNIGHSPSQAKMLLGLLEDEIRKSTYNNINFCSVLKDNCPKMSSDSHHHISEHDQKHNPLVNCEKSSPLKEFMNKKVKPQLSCVVSSDISFDLNKNIALQKMENDLFESATREVEMLLEKGVMLMVIAPQFDATHNSIGTGNWIKSLNWRGNQSWYTAPYVSFGLGKRDYCDVSIFRKSYNNLHYITLLKAGHLAGEDEDISSSIPLIIVPGSPEQSASSIAVLESGPFNEYGLPRNNSMCQDYHVLYIDAVPGTGFSQVDDDCKECYRTNSSQVANDLVKVVIEFFKRNQYLQSVPSFIYAQSYGAQIAVKFSLLLDEAIEKKKCKGDFRGVFLISPWISPFHLIESWPEYFYNLGYIDENEKHKLYSIVKKIKTSLNKKNLGYSSFQVMLLLRLLEDEIRKNSYYNINFCNLLQNQCAIISSDYFTIAGREKQMQNLNPLIKCEEKNDLKKFMNKNVKQKLSCVVSNDIGFDSNKNTALRNMGNDLFQSIIQKVEILLKKGLILVVVTSQFDAVHNSLGTRKWIKSLNWRGKHLFYTAPYKPFALCTNGYCEVSTFRKSYNNLHYVTLLKAGYLAYKHFPEIILSVMNDTIKQLIN
ncbi:uncharacterized protein LOC142333775 isoform X2 [Lycorma delicatula]